MLFTSFPSFLPSFLIPFLHSSLLPFFSFNLHILYWRMWTTQWPKFIIYCCPKTTPISWLLKTMTDFPPDSTGWQPVYFFCCSHLESLISLCLSQDLTITGGFTVALPRYLAVGVAVTSPPVAVTILWARLGFFSAW